MINYKLRLFTPYSSYGRKEMAPKSQLCACSFHDSLRQKNRALEQIRKFPDTIRYVWTAENDLNTLRVNGKIFTTAKKYLQKNRALEQIRKFPDTIRYVWTAENDLNTLRVNGKIFTTAKKYLRKKKISGYVWTWPQIPSYTWLWDDTFGVAASYVADVSEHWLNSS